MMEKVKKNGKNILNQTNLLILAVKLRGINPEKWEHLI